MGNKIATFTEQQLDDYQVSEENNSANTDTSDLNHLLINSNDRK